MVVVVLKTDGALSTEILVIFSQTTRRHIPQQNIFIATDLETSTFTLRSKMGRLLCTTSANDSFVIELEAAGFSETSVLIYKATRRHARKTTILTLCHLFH